MSKMQNLFYKSKKSEGGLKDGRMEEGEEKGE